MLIVKALSNISDTFNDTIIIDKIEDFKRICTNQSFNYYLYNDNKLIDKIEND